MSDDLFSRIFSGEAPGKRPPAVGSPVERTPEDWDAKPLVKQVGGRDIEFFTIGQLSMALGVKPVTVRSWEQKGWLPLPIFRTTPPNWAGLPNKNLKGRRLWTREQVAGIVRIAREEGMTGESPGRVGYANKERFTKRVVALYEETMREIKEQN